MKHSILNEKLVLEKQKLEVLAEQAMQNGIPLSQDEGVMEQNRKVDDLVIQIQLLKNHQRKNRQER